MKYRLSVAVIMVSIASCATQENGRQETAEAIEAKDTTLAGCYLMSIGKDTARLQLNEGAVITGDLTYDRFEKDDNKGTVQLRADSGYLRGWYSFMAEGTMSVREVIFKQDSGKLYEAFGPVTVSGDTVHYSFPHNMEFETSHPFFKTACR